MENDRTIEPGVYLRITEYDNWAVKQLMQQGFSYEGARLLLQKLDEYAHDTDLIIEFDPILIALEFEEYRSVKELIDNNVIETPEELESDEFIDERLFAFSENPLIYIVRVY